MPKKATKKQLAYGRKIAKKYVALKIRLESPFKKELASYFAKQTRAVRSGQQIESIKPVLQKQYARVARNINKVKIKADNEALELSTLSYFEGRADQQSDYIDKTTAKLLRRSDEIARQELSDDGSDFPSAIAIALITASIFKGYNKSRISGLSVSETEGAVEGLRASNMLLGSALLETAILSNDIPLAMEASNISESLTHSEIATQIGEVNPAVLLSSIAIALKMWVTMGDKKVRDIHNLADGQIVPVDQPFIVNGQQLMTPGDGSMGATVDNLANCRCTAVYL